MEIGFLGAFAGGVLTLLSPCSAMLLPAFFSYAFSGSALVVRTGVFYLGLITTLVPLGLLAGTLGAFVAGNRFTLVTIASLLVIVLGIVQALGFSFRFPRASSVQAPTGTSSASIYALGTIYGLAGVCAGPLLGAVLTFAAFSGNALLGGVTLLVFAAGMALPLFILSLVWQRLPFAKALARPRPVRLGRIQTTWTNIVGGVLTVAVGVLMLATAGTTNLGGLVSAGAQAGLEATVLQLSEAVPNWVVLACLAAAAVVIGVVLARMRRR